VDDYRACASTVLRDASNELFILDQIRLRTHLQVEILSNSEHRFLGYESLAFQPEFEEMIQESAAVVDVGGGSLQITLFLKGRAVTTQQIVLGMVRIQEKLSSIQSQLSHYDAQVQEMIDKELDIFRRLYLKDKEIKYVIMSGEYIWDVLRHVQGQEQQGFVMPQERFLKIMKKLQKKRAEEIARELSLADEHDPLLVPLVVLYRRLAEAMGGKFIWIPGLTVSDGIAYNYAREERILKAPHDFDADIRSTAKALAERYQGYSGHTESIRQMALVLFDAIKKVHGMGNRERLLLEVAAILHDCGRYISLANQAECSYQIIMASELIGLSHLEREMVAWTVRCDTSVPTAYRQYQEESKREGYMTVAKLTAILRLANALDRSHRQKVKQAKATLKLKEKQLLITLETSESMILEKGLLDSYTDSFERIFSIRPIIREKRML
jgi:exopolyphosphatase/guanosine-5'-triphosphate,3'-diphosphate pyrophosphatase